MHNECALEGCDRRGGSDAQAGGAGATAEFVEHFVASWTAMFDFLPEEEMARLREIGVEPFEAADPTKVDAFFRQRD